MSIFGLSIPNPVKIVEDGADDVASGAKNFASAMKDAAKNMSPSEIGHTALNVAGMIPVIGAPADAINAGWYAMQGDWGNAALSAATAIPGAGDFVGGARLGENALKIGEDAAKAKSVVKDGTKVERDVEDGTKVGNAGERAEEAGRKSGTGRTEVRNGYTYTLDEQGRTTHVEGDLVSNPQQGRNAAAQRQAGGPDRLATDEGGHIVARRFDGPLDALNHFAQDANFNRGAYKSLENELQRTLDKGSSVHIDVKAHYPGGSLRPNSIDVTYTIDGIPYEKTFLNRPGGK